MVYYAIAMTSGELYHYGILGQKWGQRNGPPYPLTSYQKSSSEKKQTISKGPKLSDEQRKYLKIAAISAASALALYGGYKLYKHAGSIQNFRTYGVSEKLKDCIEDYPTGDIVLKPNTKLQRVSSTSFENLVGKGHIYCSYKFRDNKRYLSGFRKEINKSGSLDFVHKLKPKETLKIASPRVVAEEYFKIHPDTSDQAFRLTVNPYATARDGDLWKRVNADRMTLVGRLKELGYSGIVDIEDASKRKGSKPIIIFNPDNYVSVTNSRKIGDFESFVANILK